MKKLIIATCFFLLIHCLYAQNISSVLKGEWLLVSDQPYQNELVLKQVNEGDLPMDTVLTIWRFTKKNLFVVDDKIISEFSEGNNKTVTCTSLQKYSWEIEDSKHLVLSNKKQNITYNLEQYTSSSLQLKEISRKVIHDEYLLYFIAGKYEDLLTNDTTRFSLIGGQNISRLHLKPTHQFCIYTNVESDTITENLNDGTYVTKVVEKADKSYGIWSSNDNMQSVQLKFKGDKIVNYDFKQDMNKVVLIRK